MQFRRLAPLALLTLFACGEKPATEAPNVPAQPARFEPNWDSLRNYEPPQWFADAKFGIFIHWGVYAVPAFGNEWYPRRMYQKHRVNLEGKQVSEEPDICYTHHLEEYGPLSVFGYKNFIPMFRAREFDAAAWADLFEQAGARYVVPVAEHHDGFAMYASNVTEWNAKEMGPKRDVAGELKEEVEARGMRFGLSSHYAYNRAYYLRDPDFDTVQPKFAGLYGEGQKFTDPPPKEFLERWYARTKDIIDNYEPEVLWFDFGINVPAYEPYLQQLAAYYYNHSAERGREPVLQYKNVRQGSFPEGTAVLDVERGRLDDIRKMVWQTDTSVSYKSWGYIADDEFKTPDSLVDVLVDIVSKNGCLLLNVGPDAAGRIPEQAKAILLEIGDWLERNGEAIYGTRPWKTYGEGPTRITAGHMTERKDKDKVYTGEDIRFTTKDGALFAIALAWPGKELVIHSLGSGAGLEEREIASVRLLGLDQELKFRREENGLVITMPEEKVGRHAFAFKITF